MAHDLLLLISNEDVVVMATFNREINIASSLGACVMAGFQEGDVFIWVLAGGWTDVFCDLGAAVYCSELAGPWTQWLCVPCSPGHGFGSVPLSQQHHTALGWRINPWKQRKLLSLVSRGLCVADSACLLPGEAVGCVGDGKGFPVLALRSVQGGSRPSAFSSS